MKHIRVCIRCHCAFRWCSATERGAEGRRGLRDSQGSNPAAPLFSTAALAGSRLAWGPPRQNFACGACRPVTIASRLPTLALALALAYLQGTSSLATTRRCSPRARQKSQKSRTHTNKPRVCNTLAFVEAHLHVRPHGAASYVQTRKRNRFGRHSRMSERSFY